MARNGYVPATVTIEADCQTSLPLKLHFKYTEKIKEMFRRHAEIRLLEDEQVLDHGLEIGCGGFWLRLNEEQYQVLRRPSQPRPQHLR